MEPLAVGNHKHYQFKWVQILLEKFMGENATLETNCKEMLSLYHRGGSVVCLYSYTPSCGWLLWIDGAGLDSLA